MESYKALVLILTPKPNAKNREIFKFFKVGEKYRAFYEIEPPEDQGWFIPPDERVGREVLYWLSPYDGKNHSDFLNEPFIVNNFKILSAGNYDYNNDGEIINKRLL